MLTSLGLRELPQVELASPWRTFLQHATSSRSFLQLALRFVLQISLARYSGPQLHGLWCKHNGLFAVHPGCLLPTSDAPSQHRLSLALAFYRPRKHPRG